MHAIAQPLTALEARLYLLRAAVADLPDGRGLEAELDQAVLELGQACSLFRLLQALVQIENQPARAIAIPLSELLDGLEAYAEAVFVGCGISLTVRTAVPGVSIPWERNKLPEVKLDLSRARQAILHGFSLAREMSRGQTRLLCDLRAADGFVELHLSFAPTREGVEKNASSLDGSPHLSDLSLLLLTSMRAGLAGQGATVHFEPCPLLISVSLPLA